MSTETAQPAADAPLQIGRWRVNPRADEIEADGQVIKLEPLKMRLLMKLASRPGDVVLTQELLDDVWAGVVVTPSSVYQGIAQLRRLLGDGGGEPAYIETVPRKGYRLVAPVAPGSAAVGDPSVPPVAAATITAAPGISAAASAGPPSAASPERPSSPAPAVSRRWLLAAAVAGGSAWAAWRYLDTRPPRIPVRIAVLPFTDRTAGRTEQALSQGLAFDVIRAFGRYPDVDVIAPESALAIAGKDAQAGQLAHVLGIGFLLLGELVRTGAKLEIAVRLLALPDARVRWQQTFEQAIDSVSSLPQQIAADVLAALNLHPVAAAARAAGPSEAYELYVLGEYAWRPKTPEAFVKARDYFQRGIDIDPAYARNYVGLGWTWIGEATNGTGIDWPQAFARAMPLFDKALQLDPGSPEALTAQGVLHSDAARFDEARRLFERAAKLAPGYAQAQHSWGVAEFDDGWPQQAAVHFERAAELNPLSSSPMERLGLTHVFAGRFTDAQRAYRRAIELEPAHPNGYWGLGVEAYARGDLAAAVNAYREALAKESRRPFLWDQLGWLYLDLGSLQEAAHAFGQTASQLPRAAWPAIHAAYAWAADAERQGVPAAVALSAPQMPEDGMAIDVMLVRAMAGLPLDDASLKRALDISRGRGERPLPLPWFVFLGRNTLIDLAAVFAAMGQPARGDPYLDDAAMQLARLESQGNVWHALHWHRARLHALRGEIKAGLDALDAAVSAGSRRAWWARLDPAFAALRSEARFNQALARIDEEMSRQRRQLKI
jgi:DNA-binding winged helix-turn-helix (wHTH) protein/tetratricopeptide (TPR) repeat protein